MIKEQILLQVANSTWQPEFEFTTDLDAAVDNILKSHEDYFLGLHNKVKAIIDRETHFYWQYYKNTNDNYKITFADVSNWQKELFEHKLSIIENSYNALDFDPIYGMPPSIEKVDFHNKAINLLNLDINLDIRTRIGIEVNGWIPPHPMFLNDLKEMCFPIEIKKNNLSFWNYNTSKEKCTLSYFESDVLNILTQWYKIFQTIHFFEDLNGRLGGIVINILSYILTKKYLIQI